MLVEKRFNPVLFSITQTSIYGIHELMVKSSFCFIEFFDKPTHLPSPHIILINTLLHVFIMKIYF